MAAFMLPLILIFIVNFVLFILVTKEVFASKKSLTVEENDKTKWLARLRSTVAVATLVGVSWILGFFAINVAFALLTSLQGCLVCYMYRFAKTGVVTKRKTIFRKTRNTKHILKTVPTIKEDSHHQEQPLDNPFVQMHQRKKQRFLKCHRSHQNLTLLIHQKNSLTNNCKHCHLQVELS